MISSSNLHLHLPKYLQGNDRIEPTPTINLPLSPAKVVPTSHLHIQIQLAQNLHTESAGLFTAQ